MAKCCGVHPSWLFDFVMTELRKKGTLLSCSMPNNVFFFARKNNEAPQDQTWRLIVTQKIIDVNESLEQLA